MRGWSKRERLGTAVAVVLFFWICGCSTMQTTSTLQQAGSAEGQVSPPASPTGGLAAPAIVPYIPPPNSIDLCGERVPLDRQDVYERFDKEFTLVVYNHAQVYLWLKRMERYFPAIEERLRYYNLPDDLKYVAIVESDLLPNACSPKGAAGPWQFMPGTGAAYGLEKRGSVDKRYDFERATDSAFLLLNDLYKKYHNWSLAIAAYNCGDKRIIDESRIQGVRSYYDLRLPQETERYVFRILAVKAVLSNPSQFGYELPKGWGYQELKSDLVKVSLSRPVPIQTIASSAGTTYREIKRLNPIFRSDDIPAGNYEIKLPPGTGKVFELNFRTGNAVYAGSESQSGEGQDSPGPGLTQAPAPPDPLQIAQAIQPAKISSSKAKQKSGLAKSGSHKAKQKSSSAKAGSRTKQKTKLAKAGSARGKQVTKSTKAKSSAVKQKTRKKI